MASLKHGDLKNTILKKISIDEYEPKTGDSKDVMVVGISVTDKSPGLDLYKFLNNSIVEIRDVEVSPGPSNEGYYVVFFEIDRNKESLENIKKVIKEVERVSGKLNWTVTSSLTDSPILLDDINLSKYVQLTPGKFLTRAEFDEKKKQAEALDAQRRVEEEKKSKTGKILQFLQNSNLIEASIDADTLFLRDARDKALLKIISFGKAPEVMSKLGISESAISQSYDKVAFAKFNAMLGDMRALPIDKYIVIYNPSAGKDVLVTEPC